MDARSSVPLLQIAFHRCDCAILVVDLSPKRGRDGLDATQFNRFR